MQPYRLNRGAVGELLSGVQPLKQRQPVRCGPCSKHEHASVTAGVCRGGGGRGKHSLLGLARAFKTPASHAGIAACNTSCDLGPDNAPQNDAMDGIDFANVRMYKLRSFVIFMMY